MTARKIDSIRRASTAAIQQRRPESLRAIGTGAAIVVFSCLGLSWAAGAEAARPGQGGPIRELPPMSSREPAAIRQVLPSAEEVPRCERFELTLDVSAYYDNPFDTDQVELIGVFTTPHGGVVRVPGFFYQAYRKDNAGDDAAIPLLSPVGPPCWKIRFAPTQIGPHSFVVRLRNRYAGVGAEVQSARGQFTCVRSAFPGYIRICPLDGRHFSYDSGRRFFPVGQNIQIDWPVYQHTRRVVEGGGNCVRPWIFCHWTWLEWTPRDFDWAAPGHWMRSYGGTGIYNQRIAWLADEYLDRCEQDGLSAMFCMGAAHEQYDEPQHDRWAGHPYNRANGGFLDRPAKFWSDDRARRLYKRKLAYIVARYAHSPAIWAWEFWNEVEDATPDIVDWHREMGDYLRQIDPYQHLRTTSTWQWLPTLLAPIWRLPEIDFTQSHIYAPLPAFRPTIEAHLTSYDKPHVVGEGGGPEAAPGGKKPVGDAITDPEGIDFHNSLWAALMEGAAGGTLPWHWTYRIEPKGLSSQYGALERFTRMMSGMGLRPAEAQVVCDVEPPKGSEFAPVVVVPLGSGWNERPTLDRVVVQPDGSVPDPTLLTRHLFGRHRPTWRNSITWVVRCPAGGRFIVHVAETSYSVLTVSLDGKTVLKDEGYNTPRRLIDQDVSIDIPAGAHEIRVENTGGDWIDLSHYVLTHYRDRRSYADVECRALRTDTLGFFWFHNRVNQWAFQSAGIPRTPARPVTATVRGLRDGTYQVLWWDTYGGKVTNMQQVRSEAGALRIAVPAMERDAACVASWGEKVLPVTPEARIRASGRELTLREFAE